VPWVQITGPAVRLVSPCNADCIQTIPITEQEQIRHCCPERREAVCRNASDSVITRPEKKNDVEGVRLGVRKRPTVTPFRSMFTSFIALVICAGLAGITETQKGFAPM
jgi:hypothetical protein